MPTSSSTTVVVISRDRREDLLRSLPHHEAPVVLVDNGSTDGTVEAVAAALPEVRVVRLGRNRGATARNTGVRLAVTPYVAFADDDSWWAPGALAEAARVLDAHPRLAVLAGRVLVGDDERLDGVSRAMAAAPLGTEPDLPGPSVLGFLACGAVVRRSAFLQVGGFDPVLFFRGEEERVSLDLVTAGWGLAYVDSLVAHHHPSTVSRSRRAASLATRNHVLTAVMRLPWADVRARARAAWHDGPEGRLGLLRAVARSPRALLHRRLVPAHVRATRHLLDAAA